MENQESTAQPPYASQLQRCWGRQRHLPRPSTPSDPLSASRSSSADSAASSRGAPRPTSPCKNMSYSATHYVNKSHRRSSAEDTYELMSWASPHSDARRCFLAFGAGGADCKGSTFKAPLSCDSVEELDSSDSSSSSVARLRLRVPSPAVSPSD